MSDPATPAEPAGVGAWSPALLERVFEAMPAGLAIHGAGADFPCLRHNRQFLDHLPAAWRGRESLVGLTLRDLCAPNAYAPTRRLFEQALGVGEAASAPGAEPVFTDSAGSWRMVALPGSPAAILVIAPADQPAASPRQPDLLDQILPDSEARYRAIWGATNDAMALSDKEGIVVAANPAYLELYGYSAEVAIGHSFALIFPAEMRQWAIDEYRKAFDTAPDETRFESTVQRQDGTQRIVESRVNFLTEHGRRVAMLSTIRDVTERKAMEQAMRESERRFRALVELAPVGIFETDAAGNCLFANPCWERLAGIPAAAAMGDAWAAAIHPADRERILSEWYAAINHGRRFDQELRYLHADGTITWVISQANPLLAEDGSVTGYLGVILDITERRVMEQAARRSEVRYQSVIAALDAGIVIHQSDGVITSANAAAERILGLSGEQITGRTSTDPLWQTIRPDHTPFPGTEHPAMVTLRTGQPQRDVAMGIRKPDGAVTWISINANALRDPASDSIAGVVSSFIDMTAYREAQDRLEASLAEKEVLLKEVHHRVKNNLQVIISLLRLQSLPLNDELLKSQLRDTQNRVRSMALVHEQLYGAYDLAHISLRSYVQQLAATVLRSYNVNGNQIILKLTIDPALELTIDIAAPLGLILTEIISNSVKYAFTGRQRGTIAISAQPNAANLVVSVADDGIGLPAGFDPQAGASLGLQMVQRLAVQLGGTITLGPPPGTRFELTIPLQTKE